MRSRVMTVAVAVLALAVAGCTSDDPQPSPTASRTAAATPDGQTVEGFAREMLELATTSGVDEDLGTASGPVGKGTVDVRVVAMTADETGSELVLALTGATSSGDMTDWSASRGIYTDVRGIVVSGPESAWKLKAYTIPDEEHKTPVDCTCSRFPKTTTADDPFQVRALLPPLEDGTSSVTVEIPGLDPITDVPVTWR